MSSPGRAMAAYREFRNFQRVIFESAGAGRKAENNFAPMIAASNP